MPYSWNVSEHNWWALQNARWIMTVDYLTMYMAMRAYSEACKGGIIFC